MKRVHVRVGVGSMNHGVPEQSYKKAQLVRCCISHNHSTENKRSSMMMRKSTVAALSILVAVATAHPYAEWNNARYRWNDLLTARNEEIGTLVRSLTTVESSSCATVTYKETRKQMSHRVRICSADPEGMSLHVATLQLILSSAGGVWGRDYSLQPA